MLQPWGKGSGRGGSMGPRLRIGSDAEDSGTRGVGEAD